MGYCVKKCFDAFLRPISNERGNLAAAAVMTGAAMVIALGMYKYSETVSLSRQSAANESYARLNNDVVTSRLGHAVGSNAIMCSEESKKCFWNSKFKEKDFGLESVSNDGNVLNVRAKNCLPSATDSLSLTNCTEVAALADVRLVDFNELKDAKLVSGLMKSGDKDRFGALVSVKTEFFAGQGSKKTVTTSSLIRRPRALLRMVAGQAICSLTCQVPTSTNSNLNNRFCYGPIEIENDQSNTSVKVTVVNDGPGHLYRFKINRSFTPNPNFQGGGAVADRLILDSSKVADLKNGLAPGEKYEFTDSNIPCFDEKITVNRTVIGNGGQTVAVTEDSKNSKPSGTANYSFVNDSIEPNNALLLNGAGATVPATQTTTTITTFEAPVVVSGQN